MTAAHDATRRAFLQAILEAPDDDTPRLVFADWLDENGEPERAEFIRAQCRSATLPRLHPERVLLEWRARRLLERHRRRRRPGSGPLPFPEAARTAPVGPQPDRPAGRRGSPGPLRRPGRLRRRVNQPSLSARHGRGYPVSLIPNPYAETFMPPRTPSGVELPEPRPVLAGLLADARDHPDDDGPRLVLADWLQDQPSEVDRARGEFVRIQCEIARIASQDVRFADLMLREEHLHTPRYYGEANRDSELKRLAGKLPRLAELLERQNELQKRYENVWLDVLRQQVRDHRFWRGLVRVEMEGRDFHIRLMSAIGASENACWLQRLHFRNARGDVGRVFGCPLLAHLHELSFDWALGSSGLAALLASPHLGQLTSLGLRYGGLGDAGVEALVGKAPLPRLTRLDLGNNQLGPRGAAALARADFLGRLRCLRLNDNQLGAAGVQALAASPHLGSLEILNLGHNAMDQSGLAALAGSESLTGLRVLGLAQNYLTIGGLATLLTWPGLDQLTVLDLSGNWLDRSGVAAFAASPRVANLTALELSSTHLGPAEAEILAASPHLAGLCVLVLTQNQLGVEGARALADSPHLGGLVLLRVYRNDVGEEGIKLLRERFGDRLVT
jgi:uncharacterized protein (TIGR02996 family)